MKTIKAYLSVAFTIGVCGVLFAGCNHRNQNVNYSFKTVEKKEIYRLNEEQNAPTCDFALKFTCLDEREGDSIARKINRNIRKKVWGEDAGAMDNEEAVETFYRKYIATYKDEIESLYKEDQHSGEKPDEMPTWYNYEYRQETAVDGGKPGILNYRSTVTEYRGGAHPATTTTWFNIDERTGDVLTFDDVFIAGAREQLIPLIKEELIRVKAKQHTDLNIQTWDDLKKNGILIDDTGEGLFVPDNFLLEKEMVSFLYNQYDIAPYAEGATKVGISYSMAEKYMLH